MLRTTNMSGGAVTGRFEGERIVAGHGAGGRLMHRLVREVFLRHFGSKVLARLDDAGVISLRGQRLAVSTDSFVVQPLFFPGGDIGKLAVCGTVNDLAVVGARPCCISVGFILREGLELSVLERVCRSLGRTARSVGVEIVAGDTKVIERGEDSGLYINTTGIGLVSAGLELGPGSVRPGDNIVLSGELGTHEAAVALARGDYGLRARLRSDCAALDRLVQCAIATGGVHLARDPTRGGLATTLCEFAEQTGLGFEIDGDRLPVAAPVRAVARLLGLDPLYMANEGKVVLVVAERQTAAVLSAVQKNSLGRRARVIGQVRKAPAGVWLKTQTGSLRRLIMLQGEQLPRIC